MESIQKTIIEKGTAISSQEALSDITPIDWSKDVLDGKYKDKTIIKSKDKEEIKYIRRRKIFNRVFCILLIIVAYGIALFSDMYGLPVVRVILIILMSVPLCIYMFFVIERFLQKRK